VVDEKSKQFIPICRILKAVDKYSKKEWKLIKENPPEEYKETIKIHNFLIASKPPLRSERLLESAHESIRNPYIFLEDPWFYLPPLTGDDLNFVPILHIDCDFRENPTLISYRIGMIHIKDVDTNPIPECFGIRYEIGVPGSSHAYCHSQITLNPFVLGGPPLPSLPLYLPEQTPCFPLLARCPVSLLLAVLVSLYGRIKGHEIISDIELAQEYTDLINQVF